MQIGDIKKVKVEFTGSVEEVKKEINDFIEGFVGVDSITTMVKNSIEKKNDIEKKIDTVGEKKEPIKKIEEAPTQKLPTAPAKKEEAPVEVATPLPTKTAEYTAQDLQKIAAAWVNKDINNNRTALVNLLASFEVKAITFLPKEKYGAFVQELKKLGADV